MLSVIPIAAFNDNYIWLLRQDGSNRVAVVDPGDAAPVIKQIEQDSLILDSILVTHHHHDHTGGLDELIRRYSPYVIGPENPAIKGIDTRVGDGDECTLLGRRFEVMAVPGHTLDHIAFYTTGIPALLFSGDTLFSGGCGRLFEGSPEQMYDSLSRIAALPDDTLVFAAHEYTAANLRFAKAVEPDNRLLDRHIDQCHQNLEQGRPTLPAELARERQINPFLRCDHVAVQASASQHGDSDSPLATFATLRAWKDRF
ncbi:MULTISPECIES: hydroxyacylglutathione hydrolase [Halomonadaceae]|uniref:hydroxyacylglutathione hydrolase n=1 Tax=Halomonadaceae TaxID=28256 RepID=UPI00159A02AF|nr:MULTISPECIES: hydroxyacylglutathione hydrolase [Halomonas]QJQ96237.1 hydroxyacylglutathione hydrolase [Halomonas sp. PA5]